MSDTKVLTEEEECSVVSQLPEQEKKKLTAAGLDLDELKLIQIFRFVKFGNITFYKRNGKLAGRVQLEMTI